MNEIKNLAVMGTSYWTAVYITAIDSDSVTVRDGYQDTDDLMCYTRRTTCPIEYDHVPDWRADDEPEPSFTYKTERYFISEFEVIR